MLVLVIPRGAWVTGVISSLGHSLGISTKFSHKFSLVGVALNASQNRGSVWTQQSSPHTHQDTTLAATPVDPLSQKRNVNIFYMIKCSLLFNRYLRLDLLIMQALVQIIKLISVAISRAIY